MARDPADPMAHFGLGRALSWAGSLNDAIAELQSAISLNANFALAHLGMAEMLNRSSRPAEAIESANKAIRLSPRDPVIWGFEVQIARAYVLLGNDAKAIEYGRCACRRPNAGFWPYLYLIAALSRLGQAEEAGEVATNMYERWPDFSSYHHLSEVARTAPEHQLWIRALRHAGCPLPQGL